MFSRATLTRVLSATVLVLGSAGLTRGSAHGEPVWPPPPDPPRVQYVSDIDCSKLQIEMGWLGRLGRLIGGASADEQLSLPFDVVVRGETVYLTCQNLRALVEVDPEAGRYRLHECKSHPFVQPIALAWADGQLFVTDSGNGTVYRFDGDEVVPLIREGLVRPTGIAADATSRRLFVVDTGAHAVQVFDLEGHLLDSVGERAAEDAGLNFPTFAATDGEALLINDTLNYRIKRYGADGSLHNAFGSEGDGPGSFARPKGLAVDRDRHVYVVDSLFDNFQIFDENGSVLLVVGTRGQGPGEFWSPGGIDIVDDRIYVADTFNNRVQILRYVGE